VHLRRHAHFSFNHVIVLPKKPIFNV
jgi:hypothetical protein